MTTSAAHRFDKQYGELPLGYDHKYVYSHFDTTSKATDMQAAIGCAQPEKIPVLSLREEDIFCTSEKALAEVSDKLILPEACENSTRAGLVSRSPARKA